MCQDNASDSTSNSSERHVPSSRVIDIARDKARAAGVDNVSFETATLEPLGLAAESMDVVMAHGILHLIEDWRGAIKQSWRILRPGDIFVISNTCVSDAPRVITLILSAGGAIGLLQSLGWRH